MNDKQINKFIIFIVISTTLVLDCQRFGSLIRVDSWPEAASTKQKYCWNNENKFRLKKIFFMIASNLGKIN